MYSTHVVLLPLDVELRLDLLDLLLERHNLRLQRGHPSAVVIHPEKITVKGGELL